MDKIRLFVTAIRAHRLQADESQAEVSRRAGLGAKYLTLVESGVRRPSIEAVIRLCAAVGMRKRDFRRLFDQLLETLWKGERR